MTVQRNGGEHGDAEPGGGEHRDAEPGDGQRGGGEHRGGGQEAAEGRPLAVFDVDGTLSDVRHRLHHVESRPRDWKAFFRAASQDPPLAAGIQLALHWAESCDLAYVTGRPENCRADTLRWLADQGLPDGDVWMRPARDFRPARVTKLELLRKLAADRAISVVVDDDPQVCAAYRDAGFRVVRADWMPASPTLGHAQETEGRT